MKILTVVGARPQFIKAAALSRKISEMPRVQEIIVHTGQHYDSNMSDVFFEEMNIPKPHYSLGIGGSNHGAMTGQQLQKIEEIILIEKPDWVLVYGDTNSTLAGALAAVKLHVKVAHVEAGLRSFNKKMPEEINRILTDHCSEVLFSPSSLSATNLSNEGVAAEKIKTVGDIMYDVSLFYAELAKKPDQVTGQGSFYLCTIHRAENTDDPHRLKEIFAGLAAVDSKIILPLHPRTKAKIKDFDLFVPANVEIIDPVGYLEMVWLEKNCSLIITDSGGVQKEAYFHSKPCVTLRDETEWMELIDNGVNILVGAQKEKIISGVQAMAAKQCNFDQNIYGDGDTAGIILNHLLSFGDLGHA